jgi:hypothetical protein
MKLIRDCAFIILSICIAVLLVRSGVFESLLGFTQGMRYVSSFVAGLFFTSAFTTPLAIVALGEISLTLAPWKVAAIGAVGSLIGDLLIFSVIKDTFAKDVKEYLKVHPHKKIRAIFKHRIFRWLTPTLGALVIASPIPDEVGLAMMGFSRMSIAVLIPISLALNFIGILLIGLIANAII